MYDTMNMNSAPADAMVRYDSGAQALTVAGSGSSDFSVVGNGQGSAMQRWPDGRVSLG